MCNMTLIFLLIFVHMCYVLFGFNFLYIYISLTYLSIYFLYSFIGRFNVLQKYKLINIEKCKKISF